MRVKNQQITVIKPRRQLPSLTTKFDQAIVIYARAKGERGGFVNPADLARAAVAAYRLGHEDLYYWMGKNRYRWNSRSQRWADLRERE